MAEALYSAGASIYGIPRRRSGPGGLADLAGASNRSPPFSSSIGAHRLRRIGLPVPETVIASPEHRLYEKLAETDPDSAHSRYNALVRRLVSFENTAECVGL